MKWRPKFSLLTLMLLALLPGCGMLLWRHWPAWRVEQEIALGQSRVNTKISPDTRWAFVNVDDYEIEIWDLQHAVKVSALKQRDKFSGRVFSRDGALAATVSSASNLCIWKTQTGELLNSVPLHEAETHNPVFSIDSKKLVVGDSIVTLGEKPEVMLLGLHSEEGFITPAMFEEIQKEQRRRAQLALPAVTLQEFDARTRDVRVSVRVSRLGRWLLTTMTGTDTQVWDLVSGKRAGAITPGIHWGNDTANLRFSPDDSRVAVTVDPNAPASKRESVLIELPAGKPVGTIPEETYVRLDENTEHFSADSKKLLIQSGDELSIYSPASGLAGLHMPALSPFSLSPDGRRVCAHRFVDGVHGIVLLDAESGAPLIDLQHPREQSWDTALFSPDGERLYTETGESILVWRYSRPEHGWGVILLPALWMTLACAAAVVWSICRDRKFLSLRR